MIRKRRKPLQWEILPPQCPLRPTKSDRNGHHSSSSISLKIPLRFNTITRVSLTITLKSHYQVCNQQFHFIHSSLLLYNLIRYLFPSTLPFSLRIIHFLCSSPLLYPFTHIQFLLKNLNTLILPSIVRFLNKSIRTFFRIGINLFTFNSQCIVSCMRQHVHKLPMKSTYYAINSTNYKIKFPASKSQLNQILRISKPESIVAKLC